MFRGKHAYRSQHNSPLPNQVELAPSPPMRATGVLSTRIRTAIPDKATPTTRLTSLGATTISPTLRMPGIICHKAFLARNTIANDASHNYSG